MEGFCWLQTIGHRMHLEYVLNLEVEVFIGNIVHGHVLLKCIQRTHLVRALDSLHKWFFQLRIPFLDSTVPSIEEYVGSSGLSLTTIEKPTHWRQGPFKVQGFLLYSNTD